MAKIEDVLNTKTLLSHLVIQVCFVCLLAALPKPLLSAAEQKDQAATEVPEWISPPSYEYTQEGKPDPFRSFLRARTEEEQKKDKKKSQVPLGPLQSIAVTQLRLVGILWYPEQKERAMAMVELPNGKGFVLKKGTKVGRQDGEVVEISRDSVTVKEEVISILGKKETRTQVLELHTSSGER